MKRQERLERLQNKVSAVFHPYKAKIESYSPDGRQRRYAVYLYKDNKVIDMVPMIRGFSIVGKRLVVLIGETFS